MHSNCTLNSFPAPFLSYGIQFENNSSNGGCSLVGVCEVLRSCALTRREHFSHSAACLCLTWQNKLAGLCLCHVVCICGKQMHGGGQGQLSPLCSTEVKRERRRLKENPILWHHVPKGFFICHCWISLTFSGSFVATLLLFSYCVCTQVTMFSL